VGQAANWPSSRERYGHGKIFAACEQANATRHKSVAERSLSGPSTAIMSQ
jgi:hypothetical protein